MHEWALVSGCGIFHHQHEGTRARRYLAQGERRRHARSVRGVARGQRTVIAESRTAQLEISGVRRCQRLVLNREPLSAGADARKRLADKPGKFSKHERLTPDSFLSVIWV